jgi:[ribosomal protein S18]-alanine N-acetyltransferase
MQHVRADFICRPMQQVDLPTLAEFLPHVLSGNWAEEHLKSQMESSHEFLVLVANDAPETVVGFAEFYCVLDEFHLLNFAILKPWQQQGKARIFMKKLAGVMRERGCVQCLLEVRRSNLPAVRLYEKTGFVLSGVRPGYYPPLENDGPREDALLYSWLLPESP